MKRAQTELKGITTTSIYEDGDMYSLVNLRRKGGALHPVAPHVAERELCSEYDIYFIHKNEDWEHWIGVINDTENNSSDVFWNINVLDCGEVKELKLDIEGVINSVEQNGNMLIFITDDTIYYALFRNGDYVWYGELPDLIPIEWNCYEEREIYTNATSGELRRGISYSDYFEGAINSELTLEQFTENTQAVINGARGWLTSDYLGSSSYNKNSGEFGGIFFDSFFIRYAYRLYDDTNVKLSPPILVMPASDILDLLRVNIKYGTGKIYSVGIFGRTKLTGTYVSIDNFDSSKSLLFQKGFIPGMKYDLSSLSAYEGLIKGIDIFISPYVGISTIDNINTRLIVEDDGASDYVGKEIRLIEAFPGDMMKNVTEMASFYLVKSIDLGETTGGNYTPFPEKTDSDTIKNIVNLVHKRQLEDDTRSAHKIGAKKSYTYNRRLHLADIKTTYFNGFIRPFFGWDKSSPDWTYNGFPAYVIGHQPDIPAGTEVIIEVDIERGSSQGKVYSSYVLTEDLNLVHSAMISYPDIDAKKMVFYLKYQSGVIERVGSFDLIEHEFLNIAYFINDDLRPIYLHFGDQVQDIGLPGGFSYKSPNELQVSETNNPLRMTNDNILTVGNGRILALGSNVMNVANWNYGTYPLYVFTTEGVYSLKVGDGDIAYSVIIQPASLEAPVSDVICQTPAGVIFAIARGLCIINGTRVDFLSRAIEEAPVKLNFQTSPETNGVWLNYGVESFMAYLKGLTGMLYNNYKNELVVMNNSKDYNWILAFDDMSFYTTTEKIEHVVQNSFPDLKVVAGTNLLDFSKEEGDAHISFTTRPLLYGTQDVKMMERILIRATIYGIKKASDKNPIVITHYSNDGRNFIASKGLLIKEGNHKDVDTGMYGRTKFRQYTFSLAGICGQDTIIEFLESEIAKEYENTKMR
ncbi:MAG: hypothetical protein LBV72_00535 [Tannerella sp.]|jgi:hypothetical protein|nr:hypothetical protein [Tannerella sp.]